MNIFLIGYRGSGKATVGKLLAGSLWMSFVDARTGSLADKIAGDGKVVALPFDLVDRPDELAAVRAAGKVVYLAAEPDVLAQRRAGRGEAAPPADGDLARLAPLYASASHVTVETTYLSPPQTVQQIARVV